jgi:hypothetical protein
MLDDGCEWTSESVEIAMRNHTTVMFIHDNTQWDFITEYAMLHYPQYLKFAIDNGGIISERHIYDSIRHCRYGALQVILDEFNDNVCIYPANIITHVLASDNVGILKLFVDAKFVLPHDASIYAVRRLSTASLEYLVSIGHPLHENTIVHAQYINYRCAIYAYENGVSHPSEEIQKIKDDLEYGNHFRVEGKPMQKVEHGPFDCSMLFN